MYGCMSMCARIYVCPHVNACNPICMYFTHAHNLLFMKQVLFISPFHALFLVQPPSSCSFFLGKRVFFSETLASATVADADKMSCRDVCSSDDGCFFFFFNNAPLLICICICADWMRRAFTLRAVGPGG